MGRDDLYITVPSFFRCPISLDVMESPVSLCTGVTYDRSSIQRWLDSGNNTCPATMQVLHSKDLIPNHTLHRLIQIWSTSSTALTPPGSQPQPKPKPESQPRFFSLSSHQALDLIAKLVSGGNPAVNEFDSLITLLCSASESPENRRFLASNGAFVEFLFLVVSSSGDPNPDLVEVGLKILQLISPKLTAVMILKNHPGFFSSLSRILRTGRSDSRLAIAGILQAISPDPESKKAVFDNKDLLSELLQILKSYSESPNPIPATATSVAQSVLSILVFLSSPRANKLKLVRAGTVRILTNTIRTIDSDTTLTELGLTLLETLAGSAEGRASITEDPNCVPRVVQKLMKVTSSANEHGVALIWSLCYLFRDQKAKEAVMRSNGGLTKILLLMQSDCSPAVKRMCCDLLRIFRVNSKSCLASYDSKTTHIMPC